MSLGEAQPSQRPLTHRDYAGWRSISSQKLSSNGAFLAYALIPYEGDGEVVFRDLKTGADRRFPAGSRPSESGGVADPENSEPATGGGPGRGERSISLSFTADDRHLVFTVFPSKAETESARKAKKKPEEMPKGALMIVPTGGGEPIRIASVRGFELAGNNGRWLAYQKESTAPAPAAGAPKTEGDEDQRRGGGASMLRTPSRGTQYGSEVVLRNLDDGGERSFADVSSYDLSRDGEYLAYTVSSRKPESNGAFAVPLRGGEARTLLAGKGQYQALSWDRDQQRLAFYSDRDSASERQPRHKVYVWSRGAANAEAVVGSGTDGFRKGWVVSDRGVLAFSKDGRRLFFNAAPAPRPTPEAGAAQDRVVADLWHWRDDHVQPMQKVRAEQERSRSFRAVHDFGAKKIVHLSDPALADMNVGENSEFGIGTDDREYRAMVEYGERASDVYHVDVRSGERRLLLRRHRGTLTPSPDGRYAVTFTGKDWLSVELDSGKTTSLTANLGVAFHNEDHDTPGSSSPYGSAGWTSDSSAFVANDRYDVWALSPEGSKARMITDGIGRRDKIEFRMVRQDSGEARGAGEHSSIDPSKPLLLAAENLETRETGFWEDRLDTDNPPRKLVMAAKKFTNPVKAKNADAYLFSASRFDEFGDLLVSDTAFSDIRKVSDANPGKSRFTWGTAELIRYRNLDGVSLRAALYRPEGFDPSKKYPLIVFIYERLSQGLHTFRTPQPGTSVNISYYVSNGYLVLTPDIAYTIGYPGQSALKCVLPAIDAVIGLGGVDEKAIGIQGHSWGGYQIAYMLTQTTRFKAAVAGAPVANMISAYDGIRWGTGLPRQFQYEKTQSRIGGSLWQYPSRFIENSPIFSADRVKSPLLMLHNDGDDAVPWYQGIEYFLALRRLGKEVYLFNYNGEPHGLRKRPNQRDWAMRMQQFFDHHLKGAPKPAWMDRGIPYIEREQEKEQWRKVFEGDPGPK